MQARFEEAVEMLTLLLMNLLALLKGAVNFKAYLPFLEQWAMCTCLEVLTSLLLSILLRSFSDVAVI